MSTPPLKQWAHLFIARCVTTHSTSGLRGRRLADSVTGQQVYTPGPQPTASRAVRTRLLAS